MRRCEICGAGIGEGAGVCLHCKTKYLPEGVEDNTIYNNPRWGAVEIDWSELSHERQEIVFSQFRAAWYELENHTSQILFRDQLVHASPQAGKLILYGPYDSYFTLARDFFHDEALMGRVNFSDIPLEEINRIQGVA